MKRSVSFCVATTPIPQARPRFSRRGHAYDTKRCREYKQEIAAAAREAMGCKEPLGGALMVSCRFYFEPPKSVSSKKATAMVGAWYTKKKDTDNLLKSVTDGISGIVYIDDKQIVSLHGEKRYGYPARVEVDICEENS